jgi:hypothetical protein
MTAVYNSGHPYMSLRVSGGHIIATAILLFFAMPAAAANWGGPARDLAQKISAVTGPGAISLEITNRSALRTTDVEQVRAALVSNLREAGVQVLKDAEAAAVQIALSENAHGLVWIAEIRQGMGSDKVVIIPVPRPAGLSSFGAAALSLHRSLLWSQEEPILDATPLAGSSPEHLLVLDRDKVSLLSSTGRSWQPEQTFDITHSHPWPRDLRGRVMFSKEHLFDVYMPGVRCQGMLTSPLSMICRDTDDPWPLADAAYSVHAFYSAARNFFTGDLAPAAGNRLPAFYSAAPVPREKYVLWVLAALDGSVHLVDGINDLSLRMPWGGDVAGVRSSCGTGSQILLTELRSGAGDSLRVYEVVDRELTPAGATADFDGPVTALWSKDDGSAVAVQRNPAGGNYEAFSLSVACRD